jgi:uncharacterized membrane protein YfcA
MHDRNLYDQGVGSMQLEPAACLIATAILTGAVANSVSGMGFGLVCAPLLALVMDPRQAAALTILLSFPSGAAVLWRERRSVRLADAAIILIPGVVTTPLWALALANLNQTTLTRAAGATVILSVAMLAFGFRSRRMTGTTGALVAGATSSAMTVLAAVGAPPVALYAMNADWETSRVRGTFQMIFLPLNAVALVALGIPRWQPTIYVPALVGLGVGLVVGACTARFVSPGVARNVTLSLAAISASTLLFGL